MENSFYYWGPLLYKTKISEEDLGKLSSLCKKEKEKNFNHQLAGHLLNQFQINTEEYISIVNKYFSGFSKTFEHFYVDQCKSMTCHEAWVNYMQAGDYNPPHIHRGCDFSSVLYLNIPSEIEAEAKNYKGTLGFEGGPGAITFYHGESIDYNISCQPFFPRRGDFFIFPATLRHSVFPFKSKVERISIAANFKVR